MLGLGYLILFGVYFYIIKVIVSATTTWAKRHHRSAGFYGTLVTLCLLSPMFWDVIPVYGLHYYQCSTQGGFSVFKTPDEWKKENPGVAETLTPTEGAPMIEEGERLRFLLNQRFTWDITRSQVWHSLYKESQTIVDLKTAEVLAEQTDFFTNLKNPMVAQKTQLGDFKMWMKIDSCRPGYKNPKWMVGGDSITNVRSKFENINGEVK